MQDNQHPSPVTLEMIQQWTSVIGQAQQTMLEFWVKQAKTPPNAASTAQSGAPSPHAYATDDATHTHATDSKQTKTTEAHKQPGGFMSDWADLSRFWGNEGQKLAERQARLVSQSLDLWTRMLMPMASSATETNQKADDNNINRPVHASPMQSGVYDADRFFSAGGFSYANWRDHPFFDLVRQSHQLVCEHVLGSVDDLEGIDPARRERLRFSAQILADALHPDHSLFTNADVIERTMETGGQNLLTGLNHMMEDIARGQMKHTDTNTFEVGRNIAVTPGKVVFENELFQLIHYQPTTETVHATPLLIFPPWINRFYILDLNPQKSFVRWAVDQGISTFIVSWKSADESMKDVVTDDYVINGQVKAIETVCTLTGEKSVNVVGYCVAGTTLAMTLSWLAAKRKAKLVKSATFFTAQVDFEEAGDLRHFVDDDQLSFIASLSGNKGYLDGRYMAAVFNLLRGRDLIWNYVINNYLLGKDYVPFDLLYWNSDVTNLPARWHLDYLSALYRDNSLAKGTVTIAGKQLLLSRIKTPAYIQAGRDDHIAPPQSVWKMTNHLKGNMRFVLAGAGHIAGVVNPPSSGKYLYWTSTSLPDSFDQFVETADEHKGSWWPDWLEWLQPYLGGTVAAEGLRIPGGHADYPAIEDAPGRYVKMR